MSERLSDHLSLIPIFSSLSAQELQVIEKYVCFVAAGALDVIKLNQSAQPVVITTLARGGSIGEMALIDKLTRSASIRACTPSSLIVLTRKGFEMILKLHPEIGIKILKGVASLLSINLRKTSDKLAEFMPPLV